MSTASLTPLQVRMLKALAGLTPPWTLSGGGAILGFYSQHRTTRDLDLCWRGLTRLEKIGEAVRDRLASHRLPAKLIQRAAGFERWVVTEGEDSCVLDLVADVVPAIRPPESRSLDGVTISVDSLHELLVNKLTALLGRSELRDLADVRALLAAGADLALGIHDAPRKDSGFSPLTLSWLVQSLPVRAQAAASGLAERELAELEAFRDDLARRLASSSMPVGGPDGHEPRSS